MPLYLGASVAGYWGLLGATASLFTRACRKLGKHIAARGWRLGRDGHADEIRGGWQLNALGQSPRLLVAAALICVALLLRALFNMR